MMQSPLYSSGNPPRGVHLGKSPRGEGGGKSTSEDILWGRAYSEQYSILKSLRGGTKFPPPK